MTEVITYLHVKLSANICTTLEQNETDKEINLEDIELVKHGDTVVVSDKG